MILVVSGVCTVPLKFSRIVEVLHGPRTVPLLAQVGVGCHLVEDGVFVDPKPHVFDDLFVERLVVLLLLASLFKHLEAILRWVHLDLVQDLVLLLKPRQRCSE